jgi:CRP-like cAMP-binding protein
MYFICRGQVEVLDKTGTRLNTLGEGDFFGELSLLSSQPRTATIRAATTCDLFVLDKTDFNRVLKDRPQLLKSLQEVARSRYQHS